MRQIFIARLSPEKTDLFTTGAGCIAFLLGLFVAFDIIPEQPGYIAAGVFYVLHAYLTNKPKYPPRKQTITQIDER